MAKRNARIQRIVNWKSGKCVLPAEAWAHYPEIRKNIGRSAQGLETLRSLDTSKKTIFKFFTDVLQSPPDGALGTLNGFGNLFN